MELAPSEHWDSSIAFHACSARIHRWPSGNVFKTHTGNQPTRAGSSCPSAWIQPFSVSVPTHTLTNSLSVTDNCEGSSADQVCATRSIRFRGPAAASAPGTATSATCALVSLQSTTSAAASAGACSDKTGSATLARAEGSAGAGSLATSSCVGAGAACVAPAGSTAGALVSALLESAAPPGAPLGSVRPLALAASMSNSLVTSTSRAARVSGEGGWAWASSILMGAGAGGGGCSSSSGAPEVNKRSMAAFTSQAHSDSTRFATASEKPIAFSWATRLSMPKPAPGASRPCGRGAP
mmetsp:Transcript_83464/g.255113  ORF Transcript_83464/g.255113 Transcript_83464/m.255113 type:complete len:295 (-) Transcript_83464:679-1563(-)